jgi:drug/metabolite transporter (DMT)-like permease
MAAIVGFAGALLVIQPSFAQFGLVSLLPLCTAILFAFYLILTRKYGIDDDPMNMQFYSGIGAVIFCTIAIVIGEVTGIEDLAFTFPTQYQAFGWLFLIGVIATIGHLLIVSAFSMAPASTLAPFQYVEIISATVLGLMIFGDFPNPSKWLGTGIIIASGLFIFWREQRVSKNDANN